jgi:hypothetical protein
MSIESQHSEGQAPLVRVPRLEDLPIAEEGFDRAKVTEAFDAFRRQLTWYQAQLRVLQSAPRGGAVEPVGHAGRMDALHLIRAAADFADGLERSAQETAARQLTRAEAEIRDAHAKLDERDAETERYRAEIERQAAETLNEARREGKDTIAKAKQDGARELSDAKASAGNLLERSRVQAIELTNAARIEVDQMLDWARAQADVITERARSGAEQVLAAAGRGDKAVSEAVEAIMVAARASSGPPPGAVGPDPAAATPVASAETSVEPLPAEPEAASEAEDSDRPDAGAEDGSDKPA